MDSSVDEKTKNKIVGIISVLIPEAKIYLFGSRARGNYKKHSDIDIALDAGKRLPIQDVDEVKSMLNESNIRQLIDVLDFHSVNSSMQESIMKEKIVWKS
ncbi:MAG: nucleotidyltransferase domain-containing protein [Candidatus Dependentiae bacterium]|nr:nucleotidyltransferase domain-containing protein [Candidatus Dependentiae bacterium]